jgi:copper transport protein
MFRRMFLMAASAIALLSFATPSVASAHAILDSSNPVASSVIMQSPEEVRLDFNEAIESTLLNVRLFDAKQKELPIDDAELLAVDPSVVVVPIPDLSNGVYVVVWQVVSSDGHPVSGAFPFEVGDQSSGTSEDVLAKILSSINTDSPLGTPLVIARFIAFLSLIVLLGTVVLTWGSSLIVTQRARGLMRFSVVGLAVGSSAVLLMQGPYASSRGWGSIFDTTLISDVMSTRLGLAMLVRLVLVLLWGVLCLAVASAATSWWKNLAFLTAVGTIATFSMSGHPSAASLAPLFMLIDAVHVGAVAAWAGGLIALTVLRREEETDAARFSRIATWTMPLAAVTGVAQGLHLLDGLGSLTSSTYGKYLLLKIVVVAGAVILGARARRELVHSDTPGFGKTIRLEALLMVGVLAVTALLVGTSPQDSGSSSPQVFSATQIRSGIVADLSVFPTRVGTAEVHVVLTPPGGALKPVTKVSVSLALPSRQIPPIPVKMYELGPNHWTGVVSIPYSGNWAFETRVQPTENSTLLYTASFDVAD